MRKSSKKKIRKPIKIKSNIQDLNSSRDGGQIALKGYSYQFLYSCYLILSSTSESTFYQLEGIEDIDCVQYTEKNNINTHIQLKYSKNKQDASFLKDVLANFLEVYLIDTNRSFKLIYDFPVAKGNLDKIFQHNLDDKSYSYWSNVVLVIKNEHPEWDWLQYDFDDFLSKLIFVNVKKNSLETEIEKVLIEKYDITTDNIALYANSIKVLCFEKMEQRAYVTKGEVDKCIQSVRIDISKGQQNPSHSWIRKLNFITNNADDISFYEGKKATPTDIVKGLPVHRFELEKTILDSINKNRVTVIKASSGQGKTTLALQVIYKLLGVYTPYQLMWCNDSKELGNILQYFKMRIRLGEKPLILIDNLDFNLGRWNELVQLMQTEILDHYRILITSRETDWYNYSGDLSNIQSLNVIKPILTESEAFDIFNIFKESKKLHSDITNWKKAWNRIADRQLLIEYVYLLTHGEMLSDRISSQMSEIGKSSFGKIKCEILRKVCFADICGIRISVSSLIRNLKTSSEKDYDELLQSMKDEFLVSISDGGSFIEGLHPIRSKHIVDKLHEFFPIEETALSIIRIVGKEELSVLFSHIPEFNIDKSEFFNNIVELLWNKNDLSSYIYVIQGLFSGCVMQYYKSNKIMFDDANAHGGLFVISTEMCPFTNFKDFGVSVDTLDEMRKTFPDNSNINYLCKLREKFSNCNLEETYFYVFCGTLYKKLINLKLSEIYDIESYAVIFEWLYNIDPVFNLSINVSLENIWKETEKITLDSISSIMYISFLGNREIYMNFVELHLDTIITYLKHKTNSLRIYIEPERKAIHIEYLLQLREIKKGNDESVSRLKKVCKVLPIFELYCADALKPTINILSSYKGPDDAHKEMPIRNIVIMFRQNITSLWNKTIMSNYECDNVTEWLEHWFNIRNCICVLIDKCCNCIYKILSGKTLGSLAGDVDKLRNELDKITIREVRYPKEDRPFAEKKKIPEGLSKIKNGYFQSVKNFFNQFAGFLSRVPNDQRLAILNLKAAQSKLEEMQNYFFNVTINSGFQKNHSELCIIEKKTIENLFMSCNYYKNHSSSKYFNKYQIKTWYEKNSENERNIVKDGVNYVASKYSICFPDDTYTNGMLSYYPIIVNNLDITSSEELGELLIGCLSFTESSFDYLVILFADDCKKVNQTAVQVSKKLLSEIKMEIESDETIENSNPPYPVDVTKQMLDCFCERYDMSITDRIEANELPIGDIAEELWTYSKLKELLTDSADSDYLKASLKDVQAKIFKLLCFLESKLNIDDMEELSDLCNKVFDGQDFNDVSFNKLIEDFAIKIQKV